MAISESLAKAAPVTTGHRLAFIDNIRWVLILIVICYHAAVTYSHVGGWYYLDGPEPPLSVKLPFIALETYDQAYFMGFLFLPCRVFCAARLRRKGLGRFLRDRAIRLGIPSLLFMLIIHPVTVNWLLRLLYEPDRPSLNAVCGRYIMSGRVVRLKN
jgi:glucans biosynthesis protein C